MDLRSLRVTKSAGTRALFRAAGMKTGEFGKPIIAVANSFTEFVPGHVHLAQVGRMVCEAIREAGAVPREFNTIAVDDGIAMGHDGMLYSLPSRARAPSHARSGATPPSPPAPTRAGSGSSDALKIARAQRPLLRRNRSSSIPHRFKALEAYSDPILA